MCSVYVGYVGAACVFDVYVGCGIDVVCTCVCVWYMVCAMCMWCLCACSVCM